MGSEMCIRDSILIKGRQGKTPTGLIFDPSRLLWLYWEIQDPKLGNRKHITSFILKKLLLRTPSNRGHYRYTQGENSVALDVYRSFEGNQYHQRRCVSCTSVSKYVCN